MNLIMNDIVNDNGHYIVHNPIPTALTKLVQNSFAKNNNKSQVTVIS